MIGYGRISVGLAALALLAAGCSKNPQDSAAKTLDASAGTPSPNGTPPAVKAPKVYRVKLETTKGDVLIEVHRNWAPMAADHFYELVQAGFYDNCRFFRAITNPPVLVQVGINGDPQVNAQWRQRTIPDERFEGPHPAHENERGFVAFAKSPSIPNSRSTQFFINLVTNDYLDGKGFLPFGKVIEGMAVADSLYGGYGEEPQNSAWRIIEGGNAYLKDAFPKLDSIKKATILPAPPEVLKKAKPKQALKTPADPGKTNGQGKAGEKPNSPGSSHPPDSPPAR